MTIFKINYVRSEVSTTLYANFVPSLRGATKAEIIPIEPDLDNANEGKMTS